MRALVIAIPALLLLPTAAGAQVPGSYQGSCTSIVQNGSTLSARCRGSNGQLNDTSIDLDRCGNVGVSNSFGRLTCGSVKGSSRPVGGGDEDETRPRRRFDQGPGYDGVPRRRRFDPDADDAPPPRYAPPPRPRYDPDDPDDGTGYAPPPRRRYVPDPDE